MPVHSTCLKTVLIGVASALLATTVFAETQVERAKPQNLLDARTSNAGPATPTPAHPVGVIVNLDNTGVLDWRFLNPRRPMLVQEGSSLQFKNNTVDRTFSISVPIAVKTTETDFKYSVLFRPFAAYRERQKVFTDALGIPVIRPATFAMLDDEQTAILTEIDRLMRLRELISSRDVLDKLAEQEKTSTSASIYDIAVLRTNISKPLSDRITALETRKKFLESFKGGGAGSGIDPQYAALAAQLGAAHKNLASLYGKLPDAKTDAESEQIRKDIASTETEIQMLRTRLAEWSMTPVTGPAVAATTEHDEIVEELASLHGDESYVNTALADLEVRIYAPSSPLGTSPTSIARVREALGSVAKSIDLRLADQITLRKSQIDKPITDRRTTAIERRRGARTMFS